MVPPPPSAELLLEHRSFLRGLSRSLVVDEQSAEDVVQQTYLAVLERPPPAKVKLRAWLAVIARNLALRTRRTQARVRRRETRAARPEAVEATVDVAARVEIQQRVAAAVAALPEPGRSAIVWRYFDGLTPTEIARREEVSVRTVESRLRRARETLRKRLDASYGERGVWRAALLPIAGWGGAAGTGWTTAATTGAQGGAPTASVLGTAAAVGVTIMNVKMMVGIAVACAAGAFFAGWQLRPVEQALRADDVQETASTRGPLLGAETTRRMKAEADLAREKEHSARLARELATLKATVAAGVGADAAGAARKEIERGVPYTPAAYQKAIVAVDWSQAGEAVTRLVPLLGKLELAFRTGKDMSPKEIAGISKWNSPLAELALSVQESMPGTGTNGAFTHPAVMVNLIHATLEHAGKPLSEAQLEMLVELGDRFVADDQRRVEAYTPETIALQRTYEEAALKDRFYSGADALLTEAQRDIMHPPHLRGRLGVDLFCSGVIWHPLSKPVTFTTRADLAPRMKALLVAQLEVPAEHHDLVEDAAAAWARSFTDDDLALADDRVLRESSQLSGGLIAGWAKIELARTSARHMLALDRRLLERLPADSMVARKLRRGAPYIAIPVKR